MQKDHLLMQMCILYYVELWLSSHNIPKLSREREREREREKIKIKLPTSWCLFAPKFFFFFIKWIFSEFPPTHPHSLALFTLFSDHCMLVPDMMACEPLSSLKGHCEASAFCRFTWKYAPIEPLAILLFREWREIKLPTFQCLFGFCFIRSNLPLNRGKALQLNHRVSI